MSNENYIAASVQRYSAIGTKNSYSNTQPHHSENSSNTQSAFALLLQNLGKKSNFLSFQNTLNNQQRLSSQNGFDSIHNISLNQPIADRLPKIEPRQDNSLRDEFHKIRNDFSKAKDLDKHQHDKTTHRNDKHVSLREDSHQSHIEKHNKPNENESHEENYQHTSDKDVTTQTEHKTSEQSSKTETKQHEQHEQEPKNVQNNVKTSQQNSQNDNDENKDILTKVQQIIVELQNLKNNINHDDMAILDQSDFNHETLDILTVIEQFNTNDITSSDHHFIQNNMTIDDTIDIDMHHTIDDIIDPKLLESAIENTKISDIKPIISYQFNQDGIDDTVSQNELIDILNTISININRYKSQNFIDNNHHDNITEHHDDSIGQHIHLDFSASDKNVKQIKQHINLDGKFFDQNDLTGRMAQILALTEGDGLKDLKITKHNYGDNPHQQKSVADDILAQLQHHDIGDITESQIKPQKNRQHNEQNIQNSMQKTNINFDTTDTSMIPKDSLKQLSNQPQQALHQLHRHHEKILQTLNQDDVFNNEETVNYNVKNLKKDNDGKIQPTQQSDQKNTIPQSVNMADHEQKISEQQRPNQPQYIQKKSQKNLYDMHKINQQISIKIQQAIIQEQDTIQFTLNPRSLGRVEVQLDIARDNHIAATIVVERQETLDLLKSDQRQLLEALQAIGFDLGANDLQFNLGQSNQQQENIFKDLFSENQEKQQIEDDNNQDNYNIDDDILPLGAEIALDEEGRLNIRV